VLLSITKSNTIQLVSSPTGNRTQPKRLEGARAIHYTIGLGVATSRTNSIINTVSVTVGVSRVCRKWDSNPRSYELVPRTSVLTTRQFLLWFAPPGNRTRTRCLEGTRSTTKLTELWCLSAPVATCHKTEPH
jgi:hypothetical protein